MEIKIKEKELNLLLRSEFKKLYFLSNLNDKTFAKHIVQVLKEYTLYKKDDTKTK